MLYIIRVVGGGGGGEDYVCCYCSFQTLPTSRIVETATCMSVNLCLRKVDWVVSLMLYLIGVSGWVGRGRIICAVSNYNAHFEPYQLAEQVPACLRIVSQEGRRSHAVHSRGLGGRGRIM